MRIERSDRDTGLAVALEVLADDARLLVLGPVGAGRTTLLGDLAAHDGRQRRVWWCRGHRVGGPSGPPLWDGSEAAMLDVAGQEPTTVLVDDVDLLDGPALERVILLAERRHELRLRVVGAHRPVQRTPALASLDLALIGTRGALHLGPLTLDAVTAWVGEGHDALALHARTGGWPELVAADLAGSVADLATARLGVLSSEHQRVLRAVCFGIPPGADDDADVAVGAAATVGLIHEGTAPQPAVADAVRAATPAADRARIAAVASSAPPDVMVTVARHLLAAGHRSPDAGALYERAGHALVATDPTSSIDLYDAAVAAGCTSDEIGSRRARAALGAGRIEEAVTSPATAGAAWAHLGRPDLAAACLLDGDTQLLAVVPLVAAGRLEDARVARGGATSADADPAVVLADGALAWANGDADGALDLFARCARMAELMGDVGAWPDSPHALATLSAVHSLDGERAEAMARTAVERAVGGGAYRDRHRLVAAWAALRAGRIDAAVEILDAAPATAGRDAMFAAALQAAIALRGDEPEGLPAIYRSAVARYSECQPDAFAPGLAAELAHLAARIGGDPSTILAPLDELSHRLGDPQTITVHLAWARVLVAVAEDDAPAARRAANELCARVGDASRLLADAATAFADVLDGVVAADAVRALADRLLERGLVFEAARLVGAAAIRSSDPAAARSLLADLRRLRVTQVRSGGVRPRPVAELSEREVEVARGVLDGRTHREIGAQLFISAKTVEHHVARIRQKLGAGSKSELVAAIREELER